jgi:hypothetical protein
MLCYVMLCYVMLCYVMLCYVMLCYATHQWRSCLPNLGSCFYLDGRSRNKGHMLLRNVGRHLLQHKYFITYTNITIQPIHIITHKLESNAKRDGGNWAGLWDMGGGGARGCRKVHSEGLHGGTVGMRWAGHGAHMGEKRKMLLLMT